MNVIGLAGSPRENSASTRLLELCLDEIQAKGSSIKVELVLLKDFDIKPCIGCDACLKGDCPLDDDDDYRRIQDKLINAQALIIASPNYFLNMPGILKNFLDRSRRLKMNRNMLQNKIFGSIVSSGLRNGGGEICTILLHSWALSQGMIIAVGLGNPIIENQLSISTLQKDGLKDFRKPTDPDEIAEKSVKRLASRVIELLSIFNPNKST
ncbi:MAG: flavodoxin family protein [Promethearchaeota archaeon]